MDLALFQHESRWLTAVRRVGHDIPLAKTQSDPANGDWYRIASGKGFMLLAELRHQIGAEKLIRCLDEFGQAHAGQQVTTDQFRAHLKSFAGTEATATFDRWQTEELSREFTSSNPWTIFSHEVEPDRVLIVYGTAHDKAAQKEAAQHLQTEVVRRFANVFPPIKSDVEVTDEDLETHYLLLIGHSLTNRISGRVLEKSNKFPVKFGHQSFTVDGELYAHPETSVIAAGENPFNPRYSAVIFTGLNAASTWRCVRNLPDSKEPDPQVILNVSGKRTRMFRVRSDKLSK